MRTDVDLGLFGPDSVSWRVHREPILAVAGLRALLLQALHPRAMAGVAQNSDFRSDPWGRLDRTGRYLATIVYGTTDEAQRAARRLRTLHASLRATDPDTGEPFRIDEPDLLRWVHVTEVESFVTTVRRAGGGLSGADADRYYGEQTRAAALIGLDPDTVPASRGEVAAYYRAIRPQLRRTPEAVDAARFLTLPPMPWIARPAYLGVASLAFGLLPTWARRLYGLPGLPTTDVSASISARLLRAGIRALPRRWVEGPIYREAMARAAEALNAGESATMPSTSTIGTANPTRSVAAPATSPTRGAPSTNPT